MAAPMPNAGRMVNLTAREQPIAAFLQNLFASVDVPAVISPQLAGSVNGNFAGPAERVLRDVARVYNLVPYYDGAAMHVVPAGELVTRSQALPTAAAERVLREAQALNLPDARNSLRLTSGNQLVVSGTKRFAEQVDELVRSAQQVQAAAAAPAAPGQMDFRVFYLRYAWAQDTSVNLGGRQIVVPGVASILRSLVGSRPLGAGAQDVALRPTLPKLKGQGLASQGVAPTAAERGKESADAARGRAVDALVNALNSTAAAPEAAQASAPAPGLPAPGYDPRQVSIEAEPRLNAVIVRDVSERLARYEQLIAALDVEPQSLEIEATIIDVNTDRLRELGINWRWNNAGNSASFGSLAAGTLGRGLVASTVLGSIGQFIARINALQAEGAARVVSSPQVVTLSNVEAVFDNTSTFFVRVAGREEVDLFNVSAGTSLRVTPHVFRDQDQTRIKLLVNVEDGSLTGRQVDQIPIVERSSINTQALIAEGESLLIGGMTREVSTSNVDKVPGLGDAPVVGNLFKNKATSVARVERMFLITPRLASSRPAPTTTALKPELPPVPAPGAGGARYTPERAPVEIDLDAVGPGR
ncbi:type III secretion system outer membrane ring subunit SctC [Azohydromonas aeria]|uniref:type III secretion system outer membrane ring subunit SctC n=1 Tax=Azohydromonas aeria TaxID=2590212 RepID=UPI0012F8D263|nr:type III secretion system outer membrane ring subunit SctC [Azohydromonas aeria]